MVVRLRLARHGTRNNPFYHIVAINDSKPRDARPIEKLGEYDPIPRPVRVAAATPSPLVTSGLDVETRLQKRIEWNEDRIKHWLKLGAQPSKPVARLLDRVRLSLLQQPPFHLQTDHTNLNTLSSLSTSGWPHS